MWDNFERIKSEIKKPIGDLESSGDLMKKSQFQFCYTPKKTLQGESVGHGLWNQVAGSGPPLCDLRQVTHTKSCLRMFIAASFATTKTVQLRCPSIGEYIHKLL